MDKLTKRLNADATNLETEYSTKELNKKEGYYPIKKTGDEDDSSTIFPLLANTQLDDEGMDRLDEYFNRLLKGEGEEVVEDL